MEEDEENLERRKSGSEANWDTKMDSGALAQ